MEITAAEQNKEKRMKRNEDSLRDLWDNVKCTNIQISGVVGKERERGKGPEKISEEAIAEIFHNVGNSHPSIGSIKSPRPDKPKEEHPKAHSHQTGKN